MDSPLSENRSSNLLVYAVAITAVVAVVLGIASLVQVSKVKKLLGNVNLVELSDRVTQADQKATTASTDARNANNGVRSLATNMEREITTQLTDIRSNISRVEDVARQASEKVATIGTGGTRSTSGGGIDVSGPAITGPAPGTLADDGTYVIKSGDNFGKVAALTGVSVAQIVAANPGVDPRRLKVGQKIVVPKP